MVEYTFIENDIQSVKNELIHKDEVVIKFVNSIN